MNPGSLKILMTGAHPDDCEICAAGIAVKYRALGHEVKFLSLTNGDTGHHVLSGEELAKIRINETQNACGIAGVQSQVLDIHSNKLEADISTRERIIRLIRDYKPDVIFTHRPNDYHPDHRRTSMLIQDSSYAIRVPNVCPDVPGLKNAPVILYYYDTFRKPTEFSGDIVISIDDVYETKIDMIHCHKSQVYEWLPWIDNVSNQVPSDKEGQRKWVIARHLKRDRDAAEKFREKLNNKYGEDVGANIKYAEAFELSEYGKQPDGIEIEYLFPF